RRRLGRRDGTVLCGRGGVRPDLSTQGRVTAVTAINRRVLPGFRLGLAYTLAWVGVLVIVPLAGCLLKASSLSLDRFLAAAWNPRARAAYSFTFGSSLAAPAINVLIGLLVAWVLVR